MDTHLYFAYGSNMDEEQMNGRCPGARKVGIAKLNAYRFIINSRGVASVVPDRKHTVHGVLWEISGDNAAALDSYEGVKHNFYHRVHVKVVLEELNEWLIVLMYIAADGTPGMPRSDYLEKIVCAAEKHYIDKEYIEELKGWGDCKL